MWGCRRLVSEGVREDAATMPSSRDADGPDRSSALDGAWGVRFPGLAGPGLPLNEAPTTWPPVAVDVRVQAHPGSQVEWSRDRARHSLLGGHQIDIRRHPLAVELVLARPTAPECVIAPHLTSAASTIATWMGRAAIHGGAFLHDGGAWALLGDKGHGKSTTLGWLATAGVPIITDDLVVSDAGQVLAGPRCVDLRPEPAREMNAGRDLGVVGTRERWRVDVPACPASSPLRGWIFLEWGPEIALERLAPIERMSRLARHRALAVAWEDPGMLLDLATRPAFVWRRPNGWCNVEPAIARLLAQIVGE
jgi:hypothetical protein